MLNNTIKRKEDLVALTLCIDEYVKCIYNSKTPEQSLWTEYSWFKELLKLLEEKQGNEGKLDVLKSLNEEAQKMETTVVSAESGHTDGFFDSVYKLLQENGINDTVIQYEIEPKVGNGAHIYVKGKFIDATIRNKVLNLLNQPDVLSKYV